MDTKTKETYSQVYGVLEMLGENYIKKLPSSLYKMIQEEKSNEYNPQYDSSIALEEQNIRKEAFAMIALFHLNYWCNSNEEKEKLKELFKENEEKYQAEIRERYNPDNLFKNKVKNKNVEQTEEKRLTVIQEEKWYQKIFNIVKKLFKRNS